MLRVIVSETYGLLKSRPISYWIPTIPFIVLLAGYFYLQIVGIIPENIFTNLFGEFLSAVLAVTTHRLVLLGAESVPRYGLGKLNGRDAMFFLYMIGIDLITIIPMTIASLALIFGFGVMPDGLAPHPVTFGLAAVAVLVVFFVSRFCLVLPGTAVDDEVSFGESWDLTQQSRVSIFVVFSILPVAVLLPVFSLFFYDSQLLTFVASVFSTLGIVVGIVFLSVAYKMIRTRERDA